MTISSKKLPSHICKLHTKSFSCLPELLPTASFWQRIKRKLRESILIAFDHPQTSEMFHSRAQILMERKRHINNYEYYIIHPFSMFRTYWNIIILFALTYHIISTVMIVLISELGIKSPFWLFGDIFISVILYMDVVINFITGYTKHGNQVIILEKNLIRKHYLCGMFIIDVLYYFPFIFFNNILEPVHKLSEIYKVTLTIIVFTLSVFKILFNYLYYWNSFINQIGVPKRWRCFSRMIIYKLIYLHCAACLRESLCLTLLGRSCGEIFESSFYFRSTYINNLLIILSASLNCGSTKTVIKNGIIDFILLSIVMIVGWLYFIYLVLSISNIFISNETSKYRFQSLLNEIDTYCKMKKVPEFVIAKIHRHYVTRFKLNYFNETLINKTISDGILLDIKMHNCRRLVINVPLFRDLPKILIENIVRYLRHEIYVPGDVILYANSVGDSMYFIATGTAIVVSSFGTEIGHLVDGAHFGEISLLLKQQRRIASIITVEICEIYKLHREDFFKVIRPHSELLEKMENTALARIQETHDLSLKQIF